MKPLAHQRYTADCVQVWLAALRETDKQDSSDQHLICEDHFLPDDISATGVNNDAIPIMPPYLDGSLGMISPWGVETSEDEDQWATACGDEDEGDDEDGVDVPAYVEPPAPKPPQKVSRLRLVFVFRWISQCFFS